MKERNDGGRKGEMALMREERRERGGDSGSDGKEKLRI